MLWSQVPTEMLQRAEVVRGGGSGVWGNLALSGVVHLITLPPSDDHLRLAATAGEHATWETTASWGDAGPKTAGWLGGSAADTDGYYVVREDFRGEVDRRQAKRSVNLLGRLTRQAGGRSAVRLGGGYFDEDREKETYGGFGGNEAASLSVAFDHVDGGGGSWELRAFGRRSDWQNFVTSVALDRDSERPSNFTFDQPSDFVGIGGLWTRAVGGRHSVQAGGDWQSIDIERTNDSGYRDGAFTRRNLAEGSQRLAGVFAQEIYSPTPRWTLFAAARIDRIRSSDGRIRSTDLTTGEPTRDESWDAHTETTFNPNLGFVVETSSRTRVRGAAYTGFRAASPSELFVGFRQAGNIAVEANPDLAPETLTGFELGADVGSGSPYFGRATVFWNDVEDLILPVTVATVGPDGGFVFPCGFIGPAGECHQRQNLGEVRTVGLEVEGEVRPSRAWRLGLSAMLIDSEVRSAPDPRLVGNRLPRVPEERLSLRVAYRPAGGPQVELRTRYLGERWSDDRNTYLIADAWVTDLAASFAVGGGTLLFAGVENLFDEEVEVEVRPTVVRVGAPRRFHAGVRLTAR